MESPLQSLKALVLDVHRSHDYFMEIALQEAKKAALEEEVPIGAVLVYEGKIIARAHNLREKKQNPLGHAEIAVISKASKKLKAWRLEDTTLYVTVEPCLMCAGAILQARIGCVIFGCRDPKAGAVVSLYQVLEDTRLNHRVKVEGGIREMESKLLMMHFFKKLRGKQVGLFKKA
ncbi:MAG: nucleoside deaminase [Deltaproteobacteria bacterium]|nr:nucleoside deaminase [Deltaproteobacteria bacterium]